MLIKIYLGYPPENVKKWIEENYKPKFKLTDPLCFTAEESNVKMSFNKGTEDNQIVISTDKQIWSNYEFGTEITLANVGDKVYFKAADDVENGSFEGYGFNISSGKIAASGNLNTLLKADGSVLDLNERYYCYSNMFYGCTSLTKAPELPATTLSEGCYSGMFLDCSSLTKAPELPATTLANNCYYYMFYGCSSLTKAPELPAETLAESCYEYMFGDCTSLTQAPELPATTLFSKCYVRMFINCKSLTHAFFPNLEREIVGTKVVENQRAFYNTASDIETVCKDGILIINSSEA